MRLYQVIVFYRQGDVAYSNGSQRGRSPMLNSNIHYVCNKTNEAAILKLKSSFNPEHLEPRLKELCRDITSYYTLNDSTSGGRSSNIDSAGSNKEVYEKYALT